MDDRQNLSQPESVITTTEKSPSRNLQKKTCTAGQKQLPKVISGVTFRDGIKVASEV
jgi:hypothetical protein